MQIVEFKIDEQFFGVDVRFVQSVVRMVEILPVPDAPKYMMGVINLRGTIVPVLNLRNLFNYPAREADLADQLLICEVNGVCAVVWVDDVVGNKTFDQSLIISAKTIAPHLSLVDEAIKDDLTVIYILEPQRIVNLSLQKSAVS